MNSYVVRRKIVTAVTGQKTAARDLLTSCRRPVTGVIREKISAGFRFTGVTHTKPTYEAQGPAGKLPESGARPLWRKPWLGA